MPTNTIRDLREQKQLSQDKVAEAAGLTYSKFVRIEEGSGKTTQEEIDHVLAVLKGMEPGTRKLAGRPFKDAAKQAAVAEARAAGKSVAAVMYGEVKPKATTPAKPKATTPAKPKATPAKPKADLAGALRKPRTKK